MRVVNALIKLASEQLRICTVDVQSQIVSAYVYAMHIVLITCRLLAARLPRPPEQTVMRVVNALIKLASEQFAFVPLMFNRTLIIYYLHLHIHKNAC